MTERIILLCAGRAERWDNHLAVPKHLIPIDREPLLDRTLRLLRTHTDALIIIVAFNPLYSRPGCERFEPLHGPTDFCDTDKFLSGHPHWASTGQTVLLYGDVFFTEPAIAAILAHEGSHQFFGRREGSHFTGCPWRELFALSFPTSEQHLLHAALLAVRTALLTGQKKTGGGWDLYEYLHGDTGRHFTTIDDFTDDFDFPHDYHRFLRRYQNRLHRALVPFISPQLKQWKWRLHRWRQKLAPAVSQPPKE